MIEDFIALFEHVYWSAMVFNGIGLILGFVVISCHQSAFKAAGLKELLKNPVESIYILTVFSTIGNLIIMVALFKYLTENRLGLLPSKQEFLFALYHGLQGIVSCGWHLFSFLVLKLYRRLGHLYV